jgi:hypothetical protein
VLTCLCLLLIAQQTLAQNKGNSVTQAFKSGEKLVYSLRYGIAKGAETSFRTYDTIENGQKLRAHLLEGYTTGLLDLLYPVYDVYCAYVDPKTDLPIRAIRNVHEQKYVDYKLDTFLRGRAGDSTLVVRENGDTLTLPPATLDLVSAFFYLRNRLDQIDLKPGLRINLPTMFNGEYFGLMVEYRGEELLKTKFGKLKCLRLVPYVQAGGLFTEEDGLTVWLTADANHLPIKIRFKLFLGALTCELEQFQGLRWPLEVMM